MGLIAELRRRNVFQAAELQPYDVRTAADAAWVLLQSGESERARALAQAVIARPDGELRAGYNQFGLARARSYVILADPDAAIEELRLTVDEGWRANWWYVFDLDPVFEELREQPGFVQLREWVATDMREQLARAPQVEPHRGEGAD